ncbi:hypothetical protein [Mucilaginibacter sp.]|uniref:hypothetical protein n=1 Tax=Mucilaginibacter sp. TaxID=1882438 RepID=UPI0028514FF7|nr:hypothetical protein [Mucilaginibacter sp.]MDR3693699.1 hypothetical protein [Mucilaginibacter sp.]
MLNITVPSDGPSKLTFSLFESYDIPAPVGGADAEINNDLILKFEDEEEAITYAEQLENLANELNDKTTTQYLSINDIIVAIWNDEFIQSYQSK